MYSSNFVQNLFISLHAVISNEFTNEAIAEASACDKLQFHERCGTLVKLSNSRRTAERQRPLDEFNNGVVMTARPLRDDEMFEVSAIMNCLMSLVHQV